MKLYKVIGNSRFDHVFTIGQMVEFVREYADGVYEVVGWYQHLWVTQDIHPRDLQEVSETDHDYDLSLAYIDLKEEE